MKVTLLTLILTLTWTLTPTSAAYTKSTLALSSTQWVRATHDVNSDGQLDILTVPDRGASSALLYLSDGSGGYTSPPTTIPGSNTRYVADFGYIDGDAHVDLVLTRDSPAISWMKGDGSGTFSSETTISTLAYATYDGFHVANLDGTNNDDVVFAPYTLHYGGLYLFLNDNGLGTSWTTITLTPPLTVSNSDNIYLSVTLHDANKDGTLDIFATAHFRTPTTQMDYWLSTAPGTWAPSTFTISHAVRNVALVDLSGDGIEDLVFSRNGGSGYPKIAYAPATSTAVWDPSSSSWATILYSGVTSPDRLTIADVNGDGVLDMFILDGSTRQLRFLQGSSSGFINLGVLDFTLDVTPVASAYVDLYGDGHPDWIASSSSSTSTSILSMTGFPVYDFPSSRSTGPFSVPNSRCALSLDLNLDTRHDVVFASGTSLLAIYSNNGGGLPIGTDPTGLATLPDSAVALAVADVTADAAFDIAVATATDVLLIRNAGFEPAPTPLPSLLQGGLSIQGTVLDLAFADLDANICPDLVLTTSQAVYTFLASLPCDGSFAPPALLVSSVTPTLLPVAVVDIDDDSVTDIVWGDTNGAGALMGAIGNGDGTFAPPAPLSTGTLGSATEVHLAFLSQSPGDTHPDFLIVKSDGTFNALLASGPGTYPNTLAWTLPWSAPSVSSVSVRDLNNNGHSELVFLAENPIPSLEVWIGSSTNTYTQRVTLTSGMSLIDTTAIVPDLLLATYTSDSVGGYSGFFSFLAFVDNGGAFVINPSRGFASVPARKTVAPMSRPECGGVSGTLSCLTADMALAFDSGPHGSQVKVMLPSQPLVHCAKIRTPVITSTLTLKGSGPGSGFDCAAGGGGAVATLTEANIGWLYMEDLVIKGGTWSPSSPATLSMTVSTTAMGSISLTRVNVSSCSSAGVPLPFSGKGGALAAVGGNVDMIDCIFEDNTSKDSGGAISILGDVSFNPTNVIFRRNTAGSHGGAVSIQGGNAASMVNLWDLVFEHNVALAGSGGALYASVEQLSMFSMDQVQYIGNSAPAGAGGGLALEVDDPFSWITISGLTFTSNSALWGGSIGVWGEGVSLPTKSGAAIVVEEDDPNPGTPGISFPYLRLPSLNITDSSAEFGGLFFVCKAGIEVEAPAHIEPGHASSAGGGVYLCAPSDKRWVRTPPGLSLEGSLGLGGVGPINATTPFSIQLAEPIPSVVPSGAPLSGGAFALYDELGHVLSDAVTALSVTSPSLSHVLGGLTFGLRASPASGLFELDPLTVAAVNVPADLGDVEIEVSLLDGGPDGPKMSVTVKLGVCPVDMGRISSPGTPLVCSECGPGLFSPNVSIAPCEVRPVCVGTDVLFGSTCHRCPENTVRTAPDANSTIPAGDCVCERGFWVRSQSVNVACEPCPLGASCEGGTAPPMNNAGWAPQTPGALDAFVECPVPDACLTGYRCAKGYTGLWCKDCGDGYFRQPNGSCDVCPGASVSLFVLLIVLLVLTALVAVGVVTLAISALSKEEDASTAVLVRHKLLPNAVTQGIFFLQVLGVLASTKEFAWPEPPVQDVLDAATVANLGLNWFATECTVTSFGVHYVFSILLPIALAVVVSLTVVCLRFFPGVAPCLRGDVLARVGLRTAAERVVFLLAPMLYIPMSRLSLVILDCSRFPDGKWYLDADYSVECWAGGEWAAVLPFGVAAVALYVLLLPIYMGVTLFRFRNSLSEWRVQARLGVIINSYRAQWFFEELLLLFKRLAIVSSALFFSNVMLALFTGLFGTYLLFTLHQLSHKPYHSAENNSLEARLNVAVMVIILCGVAFWADAHSNSFSYGLTIVIVLSAIGGAVVALLVAGTREVAQRRRRRTVVGDAASAGGAMTRHDLRLVRWIEERVPDVEAPDLRHAIESILSQDWNRGKVNATAEMVDLAWGSGTSGVGSGSESWGNDASVSSELTSSA